MSANKRVVASFGPLKLRMLVSWGKKASKCLFHPPNPTPFIKRPVGKKLSAGYGQRLPLPSWPLRQRRDAAHRLQRTCHGAGDEVPHGALGEG